MTATDPHVRAQVSCRSLRDQRALTMNIPINWKQQCCWADDDSCTEPCETTGRWGQGSLQVVHSGCPKCACTQDASCCTRTQATSLAPLPFPHVIVGLNEPGPIMRPEQLGTLVVQALSRKGSHLKLILSLAHFPRGTDRQICGAIAVKPALGPSRTRW